MKAYYVVYDASGSEWVKVGQATNAKQVKRIVNQLEKWVVGYLYTKSFDCYSTSSEDNYRITPETREKYPSIYHSYMLQQRIKKAGTK